MTTFLGCIADDFTGATDLAGLLARSGAAVNLRLGVPESHVEATAPFEVIALKCRTAPVDDAVSECRAALRWLKDAGAQRFFWKYCSTFDSTPTGNIGPVAEALMADLGASQTIYCPAFPENGRSVFMGHLFVGRQLLAESPMKDHPLTPMRDSNLMRLLQPQVTKPVGLVDRLTVARGSDAVRASLAEHARDGTAHIVVDAVADEDLVTIARACREMSLMTGGSALAMPLPALYAADGLITLDQSEDQPADIAHPAIVLSGSCSAMTRAQVAAYKKQGPSLQLDPVGLDQSGLEPALDWLAHQPLSATPMIYATADPDTVQKAQDTLSVATAGALVEKAMAALAVAARNKGVRRFVVAGGETAGAVAQALDVSRLTIGSEIAPGVPWTFSTSDGFDVALALKSGNFGAESFFSDALAKLDAS